MISSSNFEGFETRSLPTSCVPAHFDLLVRPSMSHASSAAPFTHCFPRNFTFYVSHPIRSIREQFFDQHVSGVSQHNGADSKSAERTDHRSMFQPDRWFAGTARCDRCRHARTEQVSASSRNRARKKVAIET